MTELELTDPAAFPPQPPPASLRVAEYMSEASAASQSVIRDWRPQRLSYGPHPSQKLDVFRAPDRDAPRPALIFFHGGAWTSGYLWWSGFMAPGVRQAGAVLVAPTYRLGPEHRFPTQLEDVAAAIAWVWNNADSVGIDRTRLAVGGHSAGGHLAALATLHPHALADAGISSRVIRACFPLSTSFNLHYPDAQPGSGEERVYKTLLADPSHDHAASPVNYLSPAAPPFHIVVGENDFDRIKRTSRDMVAALRGRNLQVGFEEWGGCDHFATHLALTRAGHPWFERVRETLLPETPERTPC